MPVGFVKNKCTAIVPCDRFPGLIIVCTENNYGKISPCFYIFVLCMTFLIKNAKITDPLSPYHGKKLDLIIKKGIVAEIGKNLQARSAKVIEGEDLYVSPGWVDIMADYCEPGYEYRENIYSGLEAARAGGFSDVFVVPNTNPVAGTRSVLEYMLRKAAGHDTRLHVLGAVSKNTEGKDLAEMLDMRAGGAVAFSDGWKPVQNAGLMVKALEYVKAFNGIIIQVPILAALAEGGLVNEGETSVRLGMSGIPNIAESLIVHRDIELAKYTGSRIHFSGITTAESLNLVKKAKKDKVNVTCSVTPYHLAFTEEQLKNYNSVYKVEPPLRTEQERKQLVRALSDGTIDCIATHHRPQDWDAKAKEFEYAQPGMIGQETCFAMLQQAAPDIEMSRWVELLAVNPRQIFGLPPVRIAEQEAATLTVLDRKAKWVFDKEHKKSAGVNSPWTGRELTGKILPF